MTNATNNLPELTGSDKQIAWANDLRDAVMSDLAKIERHGLILHPEAGDKMQAGVDQMRATLATKTAASWWIDTFRDYSPVADPRQPQDLVEAGVTDEFGHATTTDETSAYRRGLRDAMGVLSRRVK